MNFKDKYYYEVAADLVVSNILKPVLKGGPCKQTNIEEICTCTPISVLFCLSLGRESKRAPQYFSLHEVRKPLSRGESSMQQKRKLNADYLFIKMSRTVVRKLS